MTKKRQKKHDAVKNSLLKRRTRMAIINPEAQQVRQERLKRQQLRKNMGLKQNEAIAI